ncbi:hypothetical protein IQ06DRAFT_337240 [Phaeosphaeriaceae sp. SRC1lsM3a]|nr:hypothetical protein IQ06DRAFT_337240 [Stagonospora sp. SRC1lsM3a]
MLCTSDLAYVIHVPSCAPVARWFFLQSACGRPQSALHSTATCHWDAALPTGCRRGPRRHALLRPSVNGTLALQSVTRGWTGCAARRVGLGRVLLALGAPACVPQSLSVAGLAALIKADCCSYLGLGASGSGHRLFSPPPLRASFGPRSNPTACYPALQAIPSLRILYVDSVESTLRFQKADYYPWPQACCCTTNVVIAARGDWAHGHYSTSFIFISFLRPGLPCPGLNDPAADKPTNLPLVQCHFPVHLTASTARYQVQPQFPATITAVHGHKCYSVPTAVSHSLVPYSAWSPASILCHPRLSTDKSTRTASEAVA